jgi:hypothetical protein
MTQIFKTSIPVDIMYNILDKICEKSDTYYIIDSNAYNKLKYYNIYPEFTNSILEYYHTSKRFYATRPLTYNTFVNIIRQICKSSGIRVESTQKYNKSDYTIIFWVYIL